MQPNTAPVEDAQRRALHATIPTGSPSTLPKYNLRHATVTLSVVLQAKANSNMSPLTQRRKTTQCHILSHVTAEHRELKKKLQAYPKPQHKVISRFWGRCPPDHTKSSEDALHPIDNTSRRSTSFMLPHVTIVAGWCRWLTKRFQIRFVTFFVVPKCLFVVSVELFHVDNQKSSTHSGCA